MENSTKETAYTSNTGELVNNIEIMDDIGKQGVYQRWYL